MEMEKALSDYFYNLALVTIAFVGFAGLYIGFKQQQKAKMTKFGVLLTENHFLLSFMVVGAALFPPLLATPRTLATRICVGEMLKRQPHPRYGPGRYWSVLVRRTCRAKPFGLPALFCGRLGTRHSAERMGLDLQVRTSCQLDSALVCETN